jgi:hypothetical protein
MKVIVEILQWDGDSDEQPKVLHTLRHACHSVEFVKAAANRVIESMEFPAAHGYRIVTDTGIELTGGRMASHREYNSVVEE